MLFASQAAAAVANARAHRSERQARARLEALVETAPVGVVVFDAGSGRPVTLNRAARRIVESLRLPGRPPEQLLEVISCRRADGREISLGEFPTAHRLDSGETVRAEEIELAVPDGRSVRTLVNATPIQAPGGAVESVVVTLQDLAPLDEIERMRAEFLSLVSHELRGPLTSIKGSAMTLLEEAEALDPAERREFSRLIVEQANHMRGLIGDLLDAGRIGAGTLTVAPEPAEVAELVEPARSAFLSGGGPPRHRGRPAGRPAPRDGRPPAHRAGPRQPHLQRRAARSGVVADPRRGGARAGTRRSLGLRRGAGSGAGTAAALVSQARWRRGGGSGRPWPGAGDLQGAGGGARRPHPGRQRRPRPRNDGHLHDPGGPRSRRHCSWRRRRPPAGGRGPRRAAAHPRGRRRPADAALRPRRALGSRLRPDCDRCPGGNSRT